MRRLLRTSVTAMMLTCMAGNVLAATANSAGCANSEDMFAMRTAAVQQRLMVAALSCNATKSYNSFVIGYQRDLQASDLALQNFFRRVNGQTGMSNYHAFKTRLANTSSIQSARDPGSYCANAQATFVAALNQKSLKTFIASQPNTLDVSYKPCAILTASTKEAPRRP